MDKKPFTIPAIVSAVMLFLALGAWPYGYYQLVRLVVCGTAIFIAYTAYQWRCMWAVWTFGAITLLFNPIAPIHLHKDLWKAIDAGVALMFIVSLSIRPSSTAQNETCLKKEDCTPDQKDRIKHNPAIEYVLNNSSFSASDIEDAEKAIYQLSERNASKLANGVALANGVTKKHTQKLIHFFYDYHLVSFLGDSPLKEHDKKVVSALLDGMHILRYGLPSDTVVNGGIFQLWTLPNNFCCFYRTFIFSESDQKKFFNEICLYASFCMDMVNDLTGSTTIGHPLICVLEEAIPAAKKITYQYFNKT